MTRSRASLAAAVLFALLGPQSAASTWSVSPAGSDDNAGTRAHPFRTWQRGIDAARPGDEVLIEPGTYHLVGKRGFGVRIDRNGTRAAPITLRSNGGRAVLDCSGLMWGEGVGCLEIKADWWRVEDIEVTGARQATTDAWSVGILVSDASDNVLRGVVSRYNEGSGITITGVSRRNTLVDCEASFNFDAKSNPPGGNADGVQLADLPEDAVGNRVVRCRSYENSDDGFDLWQAEAPVIIIDSVASHNGYVPGTESAAGDGSGFKLGVNYLGPAHRIEGNVAHDNRYLGFDRNGGQGSITLIQNRSFHNGMN